MKTDFIIICIVAFLAVTVFGWMRNKQADRNDARRERLEEKQEELLNLLKKNNEDHEQ